MKKIGSFQPSETVNTNCFPYTQKEKPVPGAAAAAVAADYHAYPIDWVDLNRKIEILKVSHFGLTLSYITDIGGHDPCLIGESSNI